MTKFSRWWRKAACWAGVVFFFGPHPGADEKFLKEVSPVVDFFIEGLTSKNSKKWEGLCELSEGFLFRYLGAYETKLSCGEFLGLFHETKKRWWGRHDGSGQPIQGTFQKIWYERLKNVALKHEKAGVNVFIRQGNTRDEPMGKTPFIDLTWSGPKKYGELGWESLRLFFIRKKGEWFLKGLDIYHWTI